MGTWHDKSLAVACLRDSSLVTRHSSFEGRTGMRFAIFGVGAIGGYLGAKLAHAGEDVTFIARGSPTERVVGCVVWPAAEPVAPGVIKHIEGTRFTIGEPDGTRSERCRSISAALPGAGLKAPVSAQIRREIWLKLLGNVAFNP